MNADLPHAPVGLSAAPPGAGPHQHVDAATPRWLRPLARALIVVNRGVMVLGMLALLASALILTSSVVTRYFLHASTDWQDEASVFCLVGATFLCSAFVQAIRGHIGIEAVSAVLPEAANRVRIAIVDIGCLAFCAFFAWKSCTLLREAWTEGQTTSSSWAPPLWIPYLLMSLGMILLSVQLAVQCVVSVNKLRPSVREGA
ncbi:MAG: TRAP transporter small permease [Burkholderiales bacterium]|nr:TRAP transporter small permease [Burkholderiales bacterium]